MKEIDAFFWNKSEPAKSCMLALRHYLLHSEQELTEAWRYQMPFYNYKGQRICYIWIDKKSGNPYLGIVNGNLLEHPLLIAEKRSRMKILRIDPDDDLPITIISEVLTMAIGLCRN